MDELQIKSSDEELKQFFDAVLKMRRSTDPFPVNLDDMWWLVFAQKKDAIRHLKTSDRFKEGEDYIFMDDRKGPKEKSSKQIFEGKYKYISLQPDTLKNFKLKSEEDNTFREGKYSKGQPSKPCFLSVPCLEYLISTRNRDVFNVYMHYLHQNVNRPEGYLLSAIGETFYNLTSCSRVEDVAEFLTVMGEKEKKGEKFPVYLNEVFSLGFLSLQGAIDELKHSVRDDYMEGRHYIKVSSGNQPGYHLSSRGFDLLITTRSGLVAKAYAMAVDEGKYPALPPLVASQFIPQKKTNIKKLMKMYNVTGSKREQVNAMLDRAYLLYEQAETKEELEMSNSLVSMLLRYSRYMGDKPEGVIE